MLNGIPLHPNSILASIKANFIDVKYWAPIYNDKKAHIFEMINSYKL